MSRSLKKRKPPYLGIEKPAKWGGERQKINDGSRANILAKKAVRSEAAEKKVMGVAKKTSKKRKRRE